MSCPNIFRRAVRPASSTAAALALILAVVGSVARAGGVDFAVSPSRLVFATAPGTSSAQAVTVYNTGAAPLDLRLSVSDFLIDDQATRASTFAVTAWVRTAEPTIHIAPGERADVTVLVDVPAGAAPGGYQAGLFIVSRPDLSDPIAVSGRLGVAVLIELPPEGRPLQRELEVIAHEMAVDFPSDLSLESLFQPTARSRTRVVNLGETFVRAAAVDRYRAWLADAPREVTAPGTTILRGSSTTFSTIAVGMPWFGPASVTTEIVYERGAQDYGTIVVQADVFIIPWRLLGLGAIGAALFAVILRRRYLRRDREVAP
jgi:hypothetical protein